MLRWIQITGLASVLLLVSCAGKPSPSVVDDPAAETAAPSESVSTPAETPQTSEAEELGSPEAPREGYHLEDEGEAPISDDVVFEEDRLPPAPEDVAGETLAAEGVEAETLEEFPAVAGESSGTQEKIPPSVVTPVPPSVSGPVEPSQAQGVRGFRVQIGASTDRGGAEDLARVARTRTQEPVYVTQESPYFKVRVGDFQDRALALQLRDRLRGNGYAEAWVVTTTVRPGDSGS